MRIELEAGSALPLHRQLADRLRADCRSGSLEPGTRLPSARGMAEALGLSRTTVEEAYATLESEGYLERWRGSGTYVARRAGLASNARRAPPEAPVPPPGAPPPAWLARLGLGPGGAAASPGRGAASEPAGSAEPAATGRDLIDLSTASADPAFFPARDFARAARPHLEEPGGEPYAYGDPRGYPPFRAAVARVLSSRGIEASPEEILVTSGSQEGLCLAAMLAARARRDASPAARPPLALVESPGYAAGHALFRALGFRLRGLASDRDGLDPDSLAQALREEGGAELVYLVPNFANPTGRSLSGPRRKEVLALAARAGAPVLEDDYLGDLRLEGRDLPALVSLAPPGEVLYAGTFSKLLAPGLRVGFLFAPGPAYEVLAGLKRTLTLSSPSIAQRALRSLVTVGGYERHLRRMRKACLERRSAFAAGLAGLPGGFSAELPRGGYLAWLRLPGGAGAAALAAAAEGEGVRVLPGRTCFVEDSDPEADAFVRINFAAWPPAAVAEGLARLGRAARTIGIA